MIRRSVCIGIVTLLSLMAFGCSPTVSEPQWGWMEKPIINGQPDTSRAHQGVVYLSTGVMACTGTLIAPDVVLTAGHCVSGLFNQELQPARFTVMFGDSTSSVFATRSVSEVKRHPGYDRQNISNDIGMLRLSADAPQEVEVIPALPSKLALNQNDLGVEVSYVGYGLTETKESGVKLVVKNDINLICEGPDECETGYQGIPAAARTICADQTPGGPCSGDSGGPAFLSLGSKEYVVGVTSYGDKECTVIGCSTKVDAFWDFIGAWVDEEEMEGELGDRCSQPDDCKSAYCVNGTCCNGACQSECQTCDLQGSVGTCSPVPNGMACGDNNPCNGAETCQTGSCQAGQALVCNDGNICTQDTCQSGVGCVYNPVIDGTQCLDGDVCNGTETCQAGACMPSRALNCDDGNECTVDSCDANQGCSHTALTDGTACDAGLCGPGSCVAGECIQTEENPCDDGEACTNEWCDPQTGCQYEPLPDNVSCGKCQMCVSGVCGPQPDCDDGGGSGCRTAHGSGGYSLFAIVAIFLLSLRRRFI